MNMNEGPRSWNNNGQSLGFDSPPDNFGDSYQVSFPNNAPPRLVGPDGQPYYQGGECGFHRPSFMRPSSIPLFPEGGSIPPPGFLGDPPDRYGGHPLHPGSSPTMYRGRGSSARSGTRRKRGYEMPNKTLRTDGEFQCDTCDRYYETRQLFDEHIATHRKCGVNGCTFTAHPKIIELHVKMQHDTGLADRIMHLKSAEDIAKWKNERKRNYPSAENVAKRRAEQAEKLVHGELLEDRQFRKTQFLNMGAYRGRGGRGISMRNSVPIERSPKELCVNPLGISFENEQPNPTDRVEHRPHLRDRFVRGRGSGRWRIQWRRPFRVEGRASRDGAKKLFGTKKSSVSVTLVSAENEPNPNVNDNSVLEEYVASDYSDSDAPVESSSKEMPKVFKEESLNLPAALASLVAAYESSENEESIKSQRPSDTSVRNPTSRKASSGRTEQPKPFRIPKPTLLEMLLAKEIRHERNVILQCVRYTVENNFFDAVFNPA